MFEAEEDPITVLVLVDLAVVEEFPELILGLEALTTFVFFTGVGSGSGEAQTPQFPPELQCLHPEQFLHAVQYALPVQRPPQVSALDSKNA
jgi:hypothetical protein